MCSDNKVAPKAPQIAYEAKILQVTEKLCVLATRPAYKDFDLFTLN